MNELEAKGKAWIEAQGYSCVRFQHRNSPDFVTREGVGFEIKRIRENTIFFSARQWKQLEYHPDVRVLFFNGDNILPEAVVPFNELSIPPSYWQNYRLVIVDLVARRDLARGRRLAERREKLGMNQSQYAKLLGISPNTVKRWEDGISKASALAEKILKMAEDRITENGEGKV